MGLTLDLPLDDQWHVTVGDDDHGWSSFTLHDGADGHEVTLRGPTERLVGLLETALKELVDQHVAQTQRRTDEKLAWLRGEAERQMAFAERELVPERLATPDEMELFGWVRFPGEQMWRQLHGVTSKGDVRNLILDPPGVDTVRVREVDASTTLPYRTDAEMRAEAPIPSDEDTPRPDGPYNQELAAWRRAVGKQEAADDAGLIQSAKDQRASDRDARDGGGGEAA